MSLLLDGNNIITKITFHFKSNYLNLALQRCVTVQKVTLHHEHNLRKVWLQHPSLMRFLEMRMHLYFQKICTSKNVQKFLFDFKLTWLFLYPQHHLKHHYLSHALPELSQHLFQISWCCRSGNKAARKITRLWMGQDKNTDKPGRVHLYLVSLLHHVWIDRV